MLLQYSSSVNGQKYRDYTGRGMGRGESDYLCRSVDEGDEPQVLGSALLSGIVKSMEMAIFSCRALKMPILIPL